MRDSVSWIRPDNNLDIEASDTNLGIHVEFTRTLLTYDETRQRESNVRESQLLGQLRDIFGEDVSYTRLNDFEIILSSDKLSNINLARRLGRLRAKRDDIRKAELFTTKTETVSHNWSEDATGESIRSEIRELGFGDILAWTDDRRTSYLDLAEEFGATEVTQYRAPPRAPPSEATTEATAPDVELSLAPKVGPNQANLIRTGQPISMDYVHNTESARELFGKPTKESPYGRWFEPAGRYITHVSDASKATLTDNMVSGTIEFQNPLVVQNDNLKWKETLSKKYGGKRGSELSQALIDDGYDAVITIDEVRGVEGTSEILDLTTFDEGVAFFL